MISPEFCLYCYQNPAWLKEKETLKAKVKKRNKIIQEQDQKIKELRTVNYNLRKKLGGKHANTK